MEYLVKFASRFLSEGLVSINIRQQKLAVLTFYWSLGDFRSTKAQVRKGCKREGHAAHDQGGKPKKATRFRVQSLVVRTWVMVLLVTRILRSQKFLLRKDCFQLIPMFRYFINISPNVVEVPIELYWNCLEGVQSCL